MILMVVSALAAPVLRAERIDLLSEDPGTWIWDDATRVGISPRTTAVRWIEQVRFVAEVPRLSLVLGASVASQSISYRARLSARARIYASAGLTTRLALPRGALLSVETWAGPVRLGLGLHLFSNASWNRPNWTEWTVRPGLGIGIGRPPKVF